MHIVFLFEIMLKSVLYIKPMCSMCIRVKKNVSENVIKQNLK